ncbi:PIN domain-containing protein [Candidatus Gottesmanbacteria bacterium]|nr:PIN domain-containing protein [Candidatus Gottesmanbacteria bacterium]
MNTIFLDSNIFLRYFVSDNEEKYSHCVSLFKLIDQGTLRPYTSPIILLECYFVLNRQYKFSNARVQSALMEIATIRNITMVNMIDTKKALELWRKTGVKLADCLVATQVSKGVTLCTYDKEFQKIPGLLIADPSKVLKNTP